MNKILRNIIIIIGIIIIILISWDLLKTDLKEENNHKESEQNIEQENIAVKIKINGQEVKATFYLNETTLELIKLFPLKIKMKDLNKNEKYTYLEKNLKTDQIVPERIKRGDIKLYGDNCLVIFYEDLKNAYMYTEIGYIEEKSNWIDMIRANEVTAILELDK